MYRLKIGLLMCGLGLVVSCNTQVQEEEYYGDTPVVDTNLPDCSVGIYCEPVRSLEEVLDGQPDLVPDRVDNGDTDSRTYNPPSGLPEPENLDSRVAIIEQILQGRPHQYLAGLMLEKADKYGIDFRALPVISILESGAGAQVCGYNATGYASCGTTFNSWEENYEVTARTLASYGGDFWWQLCVWNQGATGCRDGFAEGYLEKARGLLR